MTKVLILIILLWCLNGCGSAGDSYRARTCAEDAFSGIINEVSLEKLNCSLKSSKKDTGAYLYIYSCTAKGYGPFEDYYAGEITVTLPSNGDTGSWRLSSGNKLDFVFKGECN